jgi:hypothetical protein
VTATATEPTPAAATPADDTELRVLIAACLAQLAESLPLVRALVDSHQRGIGFLTVEGRKVMDDLIRSERRDQIRITTEKDPTRRQWLSPTVRGSGPVPIPGSVAAYAVIDEVTRLAWRIIHDIHRKLDDVTISGTRIFGPTCTACLHRSCVEIRRRRWNTDEAPPLLDLLQTAGALIRVVTHIPTLRDIHNELEDVATRAKRIVDGSSLHTHPRACPHCNLHTLIIHMDGPATEWLIQCERDPHTGNYEPCTCSDSYCQCKTTGRHRHVWKYTERKHKGTSWDGLTRAQNHADHEAAEKRAQT